MNELDDIHVIGVRHLSPAAALCVVKTLEEVQPSVVLIEGPSDATHLIEKIMHEDVQLPVSLLAYTPGSEGTLAYPLVDYSPEYQAMKWAHTNNSAVKFIDLPSRTFLALNEEDFKGGGVSGRSRIDIYQELADRAGESSYDAYWERNFEHLKDASYFKEMAFELGLTLRQLEREARDFHHAENLLREAYMRRCIAEEIKGGALPEKIVVIVGAYHAPVLGSDEHVMTDKELKALPAISCHLTLMPYSYYRLSRQAGYGAGNCGPLYFGKIWHSFREQESCYIESYLSVVVAKLRQSSVKVSTAAVIEAGQLCRALAKIKDGVVVLEDLRSAVNSLLFQGVSEDLQREVFTSAEIGTAVGFIPEGLVMTSIQDDFNQRLKKLNLEKYKTDQLAELKLDLRENRRVKTQAAAFRDLNRSQFFHQLNFLKVPFAKQRQDDNENSWQEKWFVRWQPQSEIALVDNVLWGETLKAAVHARFQHKLQQAEKLVHVCRLTRQALQCGYQQLLHLGVKQLQQQSVGGAEFSDLSEAISEISFLVDYGSLRTIDSKAFKPLLEQLFFEACLLLHNAADCNSERQDIIARGLKSINKVGRRQSTSVDDDRWLQSLDKLAFSDERNPYLSGLAFALLIERQFIEDAQLSVEMSRRLSPGMASDIAISWFEGLISHNPLELLHRRKLWESLADYVSTFTDEEFQKSLVLLRRSFSQFSDEDKRQIAQNLCAFWGLSKTDSEELLDIQLSDEESALLDELDDFDF